MKISMYQASAPRFANMLRNLAAILDKAQAHCEARKIDPAVLGGMRLLADMFPLTRQVQIACDTSKGAVARSPGRPSAARSMRPRMRSAITSAPASGVSGSSTPNSSPP